MNQTRKYLLLGSLYIVQSVPLAFFKTGFQLFLKGENINTGKISGLMGLMILPWVIKFLWAPLLDKWCANKLPRIKNAILLLQIAGALVLGINASMAFPDSLFLIIAVFFLFNLVAATQDIVIDAFAVLTLPKKEHGFGNIFQIGGYYLGEVLGGALIIIVFELYGWNMAMLAFAALFLLPFIPVLFTKRNTDTPPVPSSAKGFSSVKEYLKIPGMWAWLAVMTLYMGNQILSRSLLPTMFVDIGYTKTETVQIISVWGNSASVLAAIFGGMFINRLGRKNSLVGFGVLKVIALLGLFLIKPGLDKTMVYVIIMVSEFISGLAMVTLFTIMMDKCRLTSPGTDFTVQQSANLLATLVFVAVSGIIVKYSGGSFDTLFTVSFVVGVIALLLAQFRLTRVSLDGEKSSESLL